MVTVREVSCAKDIKEFIEFPLHLYKDCVWYIPALYGDEKKLLRSGGNSESAESAFFIAEKDGKTTGRIHAIIQHQHNLKHDCLQMRFSRFDSIDDEEVAKKLFEAAERWGASKGMLEICGPLGFSDLDREGMLVEGFEEDTTFEEQYNYEYYVSLMEKCGFRKDVDWLEFELKYPKERNPMLKRVAERALELNKLHIADNNMSKRQYIAKYRDGFFDCIEECYGKLYGTVPLTREMQDELISSFMLIVNKKYLVFVCDENERVIALGLCFPGIGQAVRKSGGRLTPAALVKLLKTVKSPEVIDLGLVAVRPEYQNAGINAVILDKLLDMLSEGTVRKCETNLNLEGNTAVMSQWKFFDSRQHKRRRCYIKTIGENKNA
jgi:GNAT superfamily N-acetyltransferase